MGYYTTVGSSTNLKAADHFPKLAKHTVGAEVPDRPRSLLQQANDAKAFPVPCMTTALRAVEAMLAEKEFNKRDQSLKKRIECAVAEHVLPQLMADWANEVRVFGNEGHTDEAPLPLPTPDDAAHVLVYANMLADYLFVLPARIKKARSPD